MGSAGRLLLALVAFATVAVLLEHGRAFATAASRTPQLRKSKVAMSAEPAKSGGFSLPAFEETDDNKSSASIVFWFILGLVFPVLHSFNLGLILAAFGWGLSTGGILSFVNKSETFKPASEVVTGATDLGMKGGEYGLKAYNFVANKTKELSA
mmetsp:Transcript_62651/g.111312  ORF Transcript_62651/g.111312 Transcript_62651/m.111312 type:complete len:153 (-) Transcript_62651:110-568(-)|eukprot:CAMPEP_0197663290 /NCGR_PEP_ID=MMETSP1338-20131121/56874_1 /TAXON_ID=43686 ORGANISM="Pelagodinium beii, Strain RCC1491" /NCGR_SAMPLE_ID=MMETSP1338 /ASSEMBLY_ACC=CAM_ASM_000754 /LENGTH=152 /DNA_ID=CAMNT_0043241587 /DNA_START=60 /DNA_END=518 /DNA_ORIENTATION=+